MSEVVKPTLDDDDHGISEKSTMLSQNTPPSDQPAQTPRGYGGMTPRGTQAQPAQQTAHSILLVMVIVLVLTNSINYVLYVRLASDMKKYTWYFARSLSYPVSVLTDCSDAGFSLRSPFRSPFNVCVGPSYGTN